MDDIKKILVGINWSPNDDQKDDTINRDALRESIASTINTNSKFQPIGIRISTSNGLHGMQIFEKSNETLVGLRLSLPNSDQNPGFNDTYDDGSVNSGNSGNSGDNKTPPPGDPNTTETLQNLIGRLESGNDYIRTKGLLTDPDIIKQTVEQNREKYNNRALGRYQIQYQTFKDNMGTTNLVFSPETQDKAYEKLLINRGKLNQYLNGGISIEKFAFNLSTVWAALPKDDSNKSYYEGDKSGNRSLVNWPTFLKTIRNSYPNVG
jgi:hypothetical protein